MKGEYQSLTKELNLEKHVKFLGYRKDIPALLKISDMAVSTSKREGLPVNIMEALASGLPVVVTNCRGNRDLVVDGENGFIVEIDDVPTLTEKIECIIAGELDFNNSLTENLKLERILKEYEKVYERYIS